MVDLRRLLVAATLLIVGCSPNPTLRVGHKGFAEQAILAEMLTALLDQAGYDTQRPLACGDTAGCHQALRTGRIDVMVDYTGTGLNFAGAPPGDEPLVQLRAIYGPLGIRWAVPLGFDNGYRVLVRADDPARTVEDLAGAALAMAVPGEFMNRPRDGYGAFLSRYGLQVPKVSTIDATEDRYRALASGQVRAIVGYATDGPIGEQPVRALVDTLGFFPRYDAVVLTRERHDLGEAFAPLEDRIDEATMQALNAEVELAGHRPGAVARRYLSRAGLLEMKKKRGPEVVLAVDPADALEAAATRARTAVRAAFPGRPVRLLETADPLGAVEAGKARLAVVGAERFAGAAPRVQAVATLGNRFLHLVRSTASPPGLGGRIATPTGSAGVAARALLAQFDNSSALSATPSDAVAAVRARELDGALFLAAGDDPAVRAALAGGGVELVSVPPSRRPVPFLRAARLPGPRPVDTLAAQIVLVGPAPSPSAAIGAGPAAALSAAAAPLTPRQVQVLAEVSAGGEAPDPNLPAAWRIDAGPPPVDTGVRDTALNILAMVFLAWVVALALGRIRERPTDDTAV